MDKLITLHPVAVSVPFDTTNISFVKDNVQDALVEIHQQEVLDQTTTATTNGGTSTLVALSTTLQVYTGTATGYSIQLPNATTLFTGRKFEIINNSTQTIQIKDGSGANLVVLGQTSVLYMVLINNSTSAGDWIYFQAYASTSTGSVNYQVVSTTPFTTTSTTDVAITGFTVTPAAGTYAVWYNGMAFHTTTPRAHWWSFYKNGVKISDTERTQDTAHSNQNMVDTSTAIISFNGSESLDVRVRAFNGSLTINSRTMLLLRLGV